MRQTTSLAVLALVNNISATKIAQLSETKRAQNQYETVAAQQTAEEQEAMFNRAKEAQMIAILKK